MDHYIDAIKAIIKEQKTVIGPLAVDQARMVEGLSVKDDQNISISGDGKKVLEHLVNQYANLFGRASIEVCKDAIKRAHAGITKDELPSVLQ